MSRTKKESINIAVIMICHERLIIQILEGKALDVHKLYQKISVNNRYKFC